MHVLSSYKIIHQRRLAAHHIANPKVLALLGFFTESHIGHQRGDAFPEEEFEDQH